MGNHKAASNVAGCCSEAFELLDEVEFECEQEVAEEIARMIEKAIEAAGKYLDIKVPLTGEGKVGKDWKSVH